ncbi:breast cancer type 1 susceptibility protein-like isoform X2 [Trichoplusia ni]|uniref:Breast cancer type 1 susceptibility protein-like isoform X2 n=1 Tax=Trichoplusia ni TaxID=7111 RepID=A0A7E5VXI4_TRINI|nr:breast cancer type 1 susceptibility protein-like isoform X2 [Trichoplusia ni]
MNVKEFDLVKTLTSQQIDQVTCLECCKYYVAPATAACGHTLCLTCWRGRRTCPTCSHQFDRKSLKLNVPLQSLKDHVQVLGEAFEKLTKTPIQSSETFSQDLQQPSNPMEVSASNIIIHTESKKVDAPPKVIYVPPPQDDWDKIEPIADTEEFPKKRSNIAGPMDIEPFYLEDTEYTTNNPRRSSRKREKNDDSTTKDLSSNVHSSRDSSGDNDKKSQKTKQTWNSVKRMRKEFSKLNKKNRNKLNVSIEMVKKTQNLKPITSTPVASQPVISIDDNTPQIKSTEDKAMDNKSEPAEQELININTNVLPAQKETVSENSVDVAKESQTILPSNDIIFETGKSKVNTQRIEHHDNKNQEDNDQPKQTKMAFIKKSALNPTKINNTNIINHNYVKEPTTSENNDDIEISIKVGNTITNIVIKKKHNDVQVKVNTDQEVQTSLGPHNLNQNNEISVKDPTTHNVDINIGSIGKKYKEPVVSVLTYQNLQPTDSNVEKSTSGKKNTASADTATAQFEITESVEKELSNIMECDEIQNKIEKPINLPSAIQQNIEEQNVNTKIQEQVENVEDLNDLDIFNSGSVKEGNVHVLSAHAPSEILISTAQSRGRTQKTVEKRNRDDNDDILPKNKKAKMTQNKSNLKEKETQLDSDSITYDALMGQVFANIDADIEDIRQTQEQETVVVLKEDTREKQDQNTSRNTKKLSQIKKTQTLKTAQDNTNTQVTQKVNEYYNEKHSENVFSILEKEDEVSQIAKTDKVAPQPEEFLTPVICRLDSSQESVGNKQNKKSQDYDDSDRSVVEETPQKNLSFPKLKRASTSNLSQINLSDSKKASLRRSTSNAKSVINLTDTVTDTNKTSGEVTVIDTEVRKVALETPLTITKFADQIKHKSTPMARKSLNFNNENDDDPEQTLCPTSEIAKTTQEREFMSKAFERTPSTPAARPLKARNVGLNSNRMFCLAGSCLTSTELAQVKSLCYEQKWTYVEKYTKNITHLIVGVDEEKKSQRSVKYMCALAASKWIVAFDWVKICLQKKEVVNEEFFEALDSTGEPGPRRSRIAKKKLFEGISFYCMPPFSVLDLETLKNMLVAAGGRVVNEARAVKITPDNAHPALLLAEPEHTQEDRFIYLAMEQSIVPVNYEWVLNCLGNYTLGSIHELLLCPSSLLPAATARWPEVLLSQDYD